MPQWDLFKTWLSARVVSHQFLTAIILQTDSNGYLLFVCVRSLACDNGLEWILDIKWIDTHTQITEIHTYSPKSKSIKHISLALKISRTTLTFPLKTKYKSPSHCKSLNSWTAQSQKAAYSFWIWDNKSYLKERKYFSDKFNQPARLNCNIPSNRNKNK